MLPLVLGELVKNSRNIWKLPPLAWQPCEATPEELTAAENEANLGKEFDKQGLKIGIWQAYKAGTARLVCMRLGGLARVIMFLIEGTKEPNWELWARVFQWFGPSSDGKPWKVTWFPAKAVRKFPLLGQDLGPEHVNGGYTQICSTNGIYIYREEEATRVLIHEMVHATCLDERGEGWTIPLKEAMVEMWAELILIAIVSRGSLFHAKRFWVKQSHWIADTNHTAQQNHNENDASDYAWRYLSGRRFMYGMHGIALPPPRALQNKSTRFTHPELEV
jgi:hypothetical protein